jgi:XTP/dITP diphosphohydrolase
VKQLVFATRNRHKLRELEQLLTPLGYHAVALEALAPNAPEVEEDAPTFAGNAEKKARAALEATGLPSLADDSGLEVDALGGAPGVRSARYAGAGHDDRANNERLLREMAEVPDGQRAARFRCALALVTVDGKLHLAEGTCEGSILRAPRGSGGFGYDPLFRLAGAEQTMAELAAEEKNRVSHRARAMRRLSELLPHALEK